MAWPCLDLLDGLESLFILQELGLAGEHQPKG